MLGIAVASAIALTGCDSIAAGAKKIADGMSSYTIVLGSVVNGANYTAVVYDSGEAVGGGLAQAENGAASIRLMPYNGKPAFSERTYQVQVTSGTTVKEAAYVAFVAGGNTHVDWGTMTVISEGPNGEDNGKGMSSYTIVLANVVKGATYTAVVYDSAEAIGGGVAEAEKTGYIYISSPYGDVGQVENVSASIRLTPYNGKPAFSERTYRVQISSGTTVKEALVAFVAGGNTPLRWGTMTVISEGQGQPSQGVLTVKGAEYGVSYEARVYNWSDYDIDDIAVALERYNEGIGSGYAEPDGTGIGIAANETLEIRLQTPNGEVFKADGKFLVVLNDALYNMDNMFGTTLDTFNRGAVTFTGGSATLTMKTAADKPAYGIALSEEAFVFPNADTKLALRITNIGTEATGVLTVEFIEDSEAFKLSKNVLPSIKSGKSSTFTVAVVAGLAAGTYEATVLVSGDNGIKATLDVSFTAEEAEVEEPVAEEVPERYYGIELDVYGAHFFADVLDGYAAPEPLAVTIFNISNVPTEDLAIEMSNDYFTLNRAHIGSIAVGGTDSFTVVPNVGLGAGVYSATVTVGGGDIWRSFEVWFRVEAAAEAEMEPDRPEEPEAAAAEEEVTEPVADKPEAE
jgi:hypothetical protein